MLCMCTVSLRLTLENNVLKRVIYDPIGGPHQACADLAHHRARDHTSFWRTTYARAKHACEHICQNSTHFPELGPCSMYMLILEASPACVLQPSLGKAGSCSIECASSIYASNLVCTGSERYIPDDIGGCTEAKHVYGFDRKYCVIEILLLILHT